MRASAAPGSTPDGCSLASVLKPCVAEGDGLCGGELHGLAVRAEAGRRRGWRRTGGRRETDLREAEAEAEAAARGRDWETGAGQGGMVLTYWAGWAVSDWAETFPIVSFRPN